MSLRCWYWFLISLASNFVLLTSRWDAVFALMFMLPVPWSITISNETVFVLKFTVFENALFISTCFSSPWIPRYWATSSDMMVLPDSLTLVVIVLLKWFRVTGNTCRNKCFQMVLEWLLITCWSCWFSCWCLFWLSAVESALLEGGLRLTLLRMVLCLFPLSLILHDTFDLQLLIWWVFNRQYKQLKHSPLRFTVSRLSCIDMFFKVWESETLWLSWHSQHLTFFFDSAFLSSPVSVVIAKLLYVPLGISDVCPLLLSGDLYWSVVSS